MKKYKLDRANKIQLGGKTLYRIIALRDFGNIKTADIGGYIQSHKNLSHEGNAWVSGHTCVYGNVLISGNSCVYLRTSADSF